MTKLIGLTGPMACGKSTVARAIWIEAAKRGTTAMSMSFAGPLKRMLKELLRAGGASEAEANYWINDQRKKAEACPFLMNKTTRHAMQTLGTEWGRECIDANLWTEMALNGAMRSGSNIVIFDDCRFFTELDGILTNGGEVFELVRDGVHYSVEHASEGQIAGLCTKIDNNRPPEVVATDILDRING
jgi:hypothetical protein